MATFLDLTTKARKDPLGTTFLGGLSNNLTYLRQLATGEHMTSGEHNTMRVPRACVSIVWGGASYSISPSSSDVASVASAAAGTVTLTLAADRFNTDMRPQLNFKGTGVATKPWTLGYHVDSATSLTLYLKQLSSALGAGNAWAATDGSFDIAIHAQPLAQGSWGTTPANHQRGDTLTEAATDWNAVAQAQADMFGALDAAHVTSTGVHDVREVAKAYAHVQFNSGGGGSYQLASGGHSSTVSSVSRTSTGICVVTFSSMTTPTQAFVSPDYRRFAAGDPSVYIMQAAQTSATTSTVYIYKYDTGGKTWALADADFFVVVHGG